MKLRLVYVYASSLLFLITASALVPFVSQGMPSTSLVASLLEGGATYRFSNEVEDLLQASEGTFGSRLQSKQDNRLEPVNLDDIKVRNETITKKGGERWSSDQVILKYKASSKKSVIEKYPDIKSEKKLLLDRVVLLNVTKGKVKDVIEKLKNDPDVEYVEPNYVMTASYVPNDPYYSYQWHFPMIQMEQAWDVSTGLGVTVAVVDTGVAYETYGGFVRAPDLTGTIFVAGYDFVNNDAHPNDDEGHGTHVGGTIAQTTNNGMGVAGIAFNARIMPVKVLDYSGSGYDSWVADGIVWATDHGAVIINLSLGGPDYSRVLEDAVNYAYNHGVTVVAASGNDNAGSVSYPAAYSNAIAVGAVRYDETRAYYSNYGSELDFVAPGGDVRVDQNGDGYGDGVLQQTFASGNPTSFAYYFYQGTSMAAPHVSGLAALLYATGYTTPSQIRQRIIDGAKDLGPPGWDTQYGYGLIQAYNSLPLQITVTSSSTGSGFVTVDGTPITTPQVFAWTQGSTHTLAANSPVSGGTSTQYVWTSWSDGGAQSHTITVPSTSTTYTANFKKQYMLTVSVNPSDAGTLSVSTGWQDEGTTVSITATASSGYSFYYWSLDGSNVGSNPSYSILMNSAHTLTAFFRGTSSISLALSSGSVALGSSVSLSGTVTPTQPSPGISAGATVTLSYSLDGATWVSFITTQIESGGTYSAIWYPPYPNTYQIKASWSGDQNYTGSASSAVFLTVTGAMPPNVTLLVSGSTSTTRGNSATFDVLITNPSSSLSTTLYFEVTGPDGYFYFDTQQVTVPAGERGRLQFTWQVSSAVNAGQYNVFVGLIPPKPSAISQTEITVT